jgi:ribose 5-phosphate isomerase B
MTAAAQHQPAQQGMKLAFGADHGGFEQKEALLSWARIAGYEVCDSGTDDALTSVDYPDFALEVARLVARGEAERGVLVCTTGLGMAIAANKVAGIRAVTITDETAARLTREHNDANVLCLSGGFVTPELNRRILELFLTTDYTGGRHDRRLAKIRAAELNAEH